MYIFLDYDGVLHSEEVFGAARRQPQLRGEGELFEHAELLIEALAPHPDVRIVLSTSWVPHLGFDRAKAHLPLELQRLVIGATYHRHAGLHRREWLQLSRYYQISTYVSRHQLGNRWLALDDDAEGWPIREQERLVHCRNGSAGLGDPAVREALKEALKKG